MEFFIVRYDAGQQKGVRMHTDSSELSIVIPLNAAFQGGGTYFQMSDKLLRPKIGDMLAYWGKLVYHSGQDILNGTRWVLVGFHRGEVSSVPVNGSPENRRTAEMVSHEHAVRSDPANADFYINGGNLHESGPVGAGLDLLR